MSSGRWDTTLSLAVGKAKRVALKPLLTIPAPQFRGQIFKDFIKSAEIYIYELKGFLSLRDALK
jgi:hypothetical protein